MANASIADNKIMGVFVVAFLALVVAHGLSYVIVEYGFFGGTSEYPNLPKHSSLFDNKLSMTDSAPTAELNEDQFHIYIGFVMYATVVLAGLGLEYLVWRMFFDSDWDDEIEKKWKAAQFVFPILAATSVGLATEGNHLCLPILVAALWKLGFPETILLFYSALYEDIGFVKRIVDFVRGVGTIE